MHISGNIESKREMNLSVRHCLVSDHKHVAQNPQMSEYTELILSKPNLQPLKTAPEGSANIKDFTK